MRASVGLLSCLFLAACTGGTGAPAADAAAAIDARPAADAGPPLLALPASFGVGGHGIADFLGDGSVVVLVGGADWTQRNVPVPLQAIRVASDGTLSNVTATLLPDAPAAVLCRKGLVDDLDGDQRPDFFCAASGWDHEPWPGERQILLMSRSDHTLRAAALPAVLSYAHSGAMGDLRKVGRKDLYVGEYNMTANPDLADAYKGPNYGDGKLGPFLLRNQGGGNFSYDNQSLPPGLSIFWQAQPGTPGRHTSSLFVDVDGDGYVDLLTGSDQDGATAGAVFLNDRKGSFAAATGRPLPVGLYGARATITIDAVASDVNHDGFADVFLAQTPSDYGGHRVQLLMNDGKGNLVDETATRLPAQGDSPYVPFFLHLGDWDGDGDEDLFVEISYAYPAAPGPSADDVALFLGDGTGHYKAAPAAMLPARSAWHQLVPVDFNKDGRLDVLDFEPESWDRPGQPSTKVFVRSYAGR